MITSHIVSFTPELLKWVVCSRTLGTFYCFILFFIQQRVLYRMTTDLAWVNCHYGPRSRYGMSGWFLWRYLPKAIQFPNIIIPSGRFDVLYILNSNVAFPYLVENKSTKFPQTAIRLKQSMIVWGQSILKISFILGIDTHKCIWNCSNAKYTYMHIYFIKKGFTRKVDYHHELSLHCSAATLLATSLLFVFFIRKHTQEAIGS